jgi:hypothetical protein
MKGVVHGHELFGLKRPVNYGVSGTAPSPSLPDILGLMIGISSSRAGNIGRAGVHSL